MSSLLDEAIVDAKTLRQAVMKSAEASLLEAYSPRIEEAVEKLLEQDPAGMGPMDIGAPPADIAPPADFAATPADPVDQETGSTFAPGDEEEVDSISYASLTDLDDETSLDDDIEVDITRGELEMMLESISKNIKSLEEEASDDKSLELDEDVIDVFEQDVPGGPQEYKVPSVTEETIDLFEEGEGQRYTVKKGDTLPKIAKQFVKGVDEDTAISIFIGYQKHRGGGERQFYEIFVGENFFALPENLSEKDKRMYMERGRYELEDLRSDNAPSLSVPANTTVEEESPSLGAPTVEESLGITEENIEEIVESLVVDLMPTKSGWAGTPESVMQHNEELAAAMAESDKYKEERDELLKVGKTLQESVEKHQSVNTKLKEIVDALREKLDEVNLANAKLLYTNRVLRKSSLNERQKETIVEALSNAGSVNEAKVIFETLQSTVGTSQKRSPQSLSEAVSRPSTMLPRRKVQNTDSNPFAERMRVLAGIKNK